MRQIGEGNDNLPIMKYEIDIWISGRRTMNGISAQIFEIK